MLRPSCCCSCPALRTAAPLAPPLGLPPSATPARPRHPNLDIGSNSGARRGVQGLRKRSAAGETSGQHRHPPTPRRAFSPFSSTRTFSFTSALHAEVVNSLPFPTKSNPTPFDIFHFSPSEPLDRAKVKGRYLDLVKLYHPDRAVAAASAEGATGGKKEQASLKAAERFVLVQQAYELLSDPRRLDLYRRSGIGWGKTAGYGSSSSSGSGGAPSPWSQSTPEYHFRRGRPMSGTYGRSGAYAYDWQTSGYTWADPHGGGGMASSGAEAGWSGQGAYGKNFVVFLVLAGVSLLVTPLTFYQAVPTAPGEGPLGYGSGAGMPKVYDKRHESASENLRQAREEARIRGPEKLEAIRRRVQQIRREQAYDRALEVQVVEQQRAGTGHQLSLPPPSVHQQLSLPPPSSP
ncbi:hypothetical protein JCM8097_007334 [Rhodosporidiobolus ruineniae]